MEVARRGRRRSGNEGEIQVQQSRSEIIKLKRSIVAPDQLTTVSARDYLKGSPVRAEGGDGNSRSLLGNCFMHAHTRARVISIAISASHA